MVQRQIMFYEKMFLQNFMKFGSMLKRTKIRTLLILIVPFCYTDEVFLLFMCVFDLGCWTLIAVGRAILITPVWHKMKSVENPVWTETTLVCILMLVLAGNLSLSVLCCSYIAQCFHTFLMFCRVLVFGMLMICWDGCFWLSCLKNKQPTKQKTLLHVPACLICYLYVDLYFHCANWLL